MVGDTGKVSGDGGISLLLSGGVVHFEFREIRETFCDGVSCGRNAGQFVVHSEFL